MYLVVAARRARHGVAVVVGVDVDVELLLVVYARCEGVEVCAFLADADFSGGGPGCFEGSQNGFVWGCVGGAGAVEADCVDGVVGLVVVACGVGGWIRSVCVHFRTGVNI